ncbi:hypothetical protein SELMODRAFT_409812 [Selaginella moellendorffii]|uniref:Protein kinase domain-containing protein n=3 Tax=Selaginella moellendorffii TaxID=88036 RepID=D8RCI8_SELML|nr:hypothetical protein SELMODRAFT_409812 [Selaginella moellendorffii]
MVTTVTIVRANDSTEVIKVRIPPAGLLAKKIYKQLERYGLHGALEVDGVSVIDDDTVFAKDHLVYIPQPSAAQAEGTLSALPYFSSPLRPSKKLKASYFQGKTRCVLVTELVGTQSFRVAAALSWLWLHLFGDSPNLSAFMSTLHERRYYPYLLAIARAAAVSDQGRVEIFGVIPDVQVIIDRNEVIPLDVQVTWSHGSVDDPDGIATNSDSLSQLLNYVLNYNKNRVGNYSCMAALIIRVQFVFFFKFHIRKNGEDDLGSLELLEYAPGFQRGSGQMTAEAGLWEVCLIDMARLINNEFGIERNWSIKPVQDMDVPEALLSRMHSASFQELLPFAPPEGFHSLVKYFRSVAPDCYGPVEFVYESKTGSVQVSSVLASGPRSCVFATAGLASVVKVSSENYIDLDIRAHFLGHSSDCRYLRKMIGHGRVNGAGRGLRFVELEGVGVPFSKKHVSTAKQIAKCWREASEAVRALHHRKVFHRDIKPSNFIVMEHGTGDQRLVLNDFDCAAHWDDSMREEVGTVMFRSPVLDEGGEYCCRDDWLSLGLSFAYLLGIFPERLCWNRQRKLQILQELAVHALAPADMKTTILLALGEEHVCCCRVVSTHICKNI